MCIQSGLQLSGPSGAHLPALLGRLQHWAARPHPSGLQQCSTGQAAPSSSQSHLSPQLQRDLLTALQSNTLALSLPDVHGVLPLV